MATKFFPERLIYVPATGGHPPLTEYRVGVGLEHWTTPVLVKKTQMVYEGKINGRVAPSFPVRSQYDEEAVRLAMELLDKEEGTNNPNQKIVVTVSALNEQSKEKVEDEQEDYIHNFYLDLAPPMTIVSVGIKATHVIKENLIGIVFTVDFSYEK
ncbi:hypothetical protein [Metabacillus fastidiosus]|uniref:hypothetical protein n=1 Tax=Metabacillus fastidiosus TaxID=1458 RepID=UPI0008271E61|nr:hypothetical protein [Metabacillus fastidiosus]MED4464754.1 hypothetical protein [Metabacillus fastidiosus]